MLLLACRGPAGAADQVVLQLKWYPQFQFAGYYMAQARGFFAKRNLAVTLRPGWPEMVPTKEVAQDRAQFGIAGVDVLEQRARGVALVSLAAIFQHSASIVVVPASSPIRVPADLAAGHTIAGTPGSPDDLELRAVIRAEGGDPTRVRYVRHPGSLEALIHRQVDAQAAYITNEPETLRRAKFPFRILPTAPYSVDFYGEVLFTTQSLAARRPDMVARFREACIDGWYYALGHPEETIGVIMRAAAQSGHPQDRAHLRYEAQRVQQLVQPTVAAIGNQSPYRWQSILEMLGREGMIQQPVDIDAFIWHGQEAEAVRQQTGYLRYALAALAVALSLLLGYLVWNAQLRASARQQSQRLALAQRNLERRSRTLYSLIELGYVLSGTTEARSLLAQVVEHVEHGAPFDHVAVYLIDEATHELRGPLGVDAAGQLTGWQHTACSLDDEDSGLGQICLGLRDVYLETPAEPTNGSGGPWDRHVLVPLRAGATVLGVLEVRQHPGEDVLDEDELRQLRGFADEIALALYNARLLREADEHRSVLEQSNRELGVLVEFGRAATLASTPDALISRIVHTVRENLGFDRAAVFLLRGDRMVGALGTGDDGKDEDIRGQWWTAPAPSESESWRSALTGERDMIYTSDLFAAHQVRTHAGHPVREHVLLPLRTRDQVLGVLTADNAITGRPFTEDDARPLVSLAHHAATALASVQLQSALRESEERLRVLVSSLPATIYSGRVLPNGRIALTFASPQVYSLTGYQPSEAIALGPQFWDEIVHPDDVAAAEEQIRDVMAGRTAVMEYRVVSRSGELHWVLDIPVPTKDEHGRVVSVNGTVVDITERRQMEEQLRQAQKMETVGTLAGGVAHDFNNLLTIIGGNIEMARMDIPDDSPAQHSLSQTLTAVTRAAELTRQLLTFSRRTESCYERTSLNDLVGETVPLLQSSLGRNVTLEVVTDPDAAPVMGDPAQLQQVFINLCVNARDAMPTGGTIQVQTQNARVHEDDRRRPLQAAPGEYVRLQVRDTGVGMDDATKQRIFEPFYTTKAVGQGTGLGLAVAYAIVSAHRGWIQVRSAPGKGSTFTIFLPAADAPVLAAAGPEHRSTVLVVDEDEDHREALAVMLEAAGHIVLTAADGSEALALFWSEAARVALVICCTHLTTLAPASLVGHLRSYSPDVPVVLSIHEGDAPPDPTVIDPPPAGTLTAPYDPEAVAQLVDALLGARTQ